VTRLAYGERVDLDHDSATALYVQLAGVIRAQIDSGQIHGRVPSPRSLAQEYGVAIGTARKALELLRDEGLIRSASGRGHFTA
jgi:GntR family transcriptional regulator